MIYAAAGNCTSTWTPPADLAAAERSSSAKVQRPGTCNSAEDAARASVASQFRRAAITALRAEGVELRGDETVRAIDPSVTAATDADWGEEFLGADPGGAGRGLGGRGDRPRQRVRPGHLEAIATNDRSAAARVPARRSTAPASTSTPHALHGRRRVRDGAEIGNSTQKLHARGPIGLRELCSTRYLVEGDGHGALEARPRSADVQPAAHRASRLRRRGLRPARGLDAGRVHPGQPAAAQGDPRRTRGRRARGATRRAVAADSRFGSHAWTRTSPVGPTRSIPQTAA